MPRGSRMLDCDITASADGTCVLAISPENEARWYVDAGFTAIGSGHNDPPNVQCPITIGVGANAEGPVDYLNTEGIKQAPRFPKGRSDRLACTCSTVTDLCHHINPSIIHATATSKVFCILTSGHTCHHAWLLHLWGAYICICIGKPNVSHPRAFL